MKPGMTLAHWGGLCVAGLAAANIADWILFPGPRQGPLTDEDRGALLALGIMKLASLIGAIVCFTLYFIRGRSSKRPVRTKPARLHGARHYRDEEDDEESLDDVQGGLSRGAILGIVAGGVGVVVLIIVVAVVVSSQPHEEKPPPSSSRPGNPKQEDVDISVAPAAGLDRLERVWILLNVRGDQPIKELKFDGPPAAPHSHGNEVSNVRRVQGRAPPAGTYYNQRFTMKLKQQSGSIGGIAVPSDGPFCSAALPSPCRLVHVRKVGVCQVGFRNSTFSQTLTFGVYEGFYDKRAE